MVPTTSETPRLSHDFFAFILDIGNVFTGPR
jgi:hypothetical protein